MLGTAGMAPYLVSRQDQAMTILIWCRVISPYAQVYRASSCSKFWRLWRHLAVTRRSLWATLLDGLTWRGGRGRGRMRTGHIQGGRALQWL